MPGQPTRRNKIKVLIAMSIAVVLGSAGDVLLGHGVRELATRHLDLWPAFVAALTDMHILSGVLLLIGFFVLYLASLSWADLSFVLPLTAGEYVLVTVFAYFFLGEQILHVRWVGSALVASGIALVTRS